MTNYQIANPQENKSSLLLGRVDQCSFYKALEPDSDITVETKFQQSGLSGFLPFSDPGVCSFMTDDFAKAVTEGRYQTWKEKISQRNAAFIEFFRAGQYDNNPFMRNRNLGVMRHNTPRAGHNIKFGGKIKYVHENYSAVDLKSFAEDITHRMRTESCSCMEAPCIKLSVKLKRTGVIPGIAGGIEFIHDMIFTMATLSNGELDKENVFFMDPNAGIFKIRNTEESIRRFLQYIDTALFSQMQIKSAETIFVTNASLPAKGTIAWQKRDAIIKEGNAPDHEVNYCLSTLCLLETYLNNQIQRLEEEPGGVFGYLFFSKKTKKLDHLQSVKTSLENEIQNWHQRHKGKSLSATEHVKEANEITKRVLLQLDDNLLSQKRWYVFASSAGTELARLKNQIGSFLEPTEEELVNESHAP
jgi:hypothetical protein